MEILLLMTSQYNQEPAAVSVFIYIIYRGCCQVVKGAGHKANRMVLQCINGVGSNPIEGRTEI